ncbi:MAG TPA: 50S ribosomal protein L10 [Thermoplasmatales archaeon]|nr:50S ribosomal protein L10 [Thermoplasmatales archaeon]
MPAQWKIKEVEELKKLIQSYPVVGIVGIRGIPAPQMQEMRARLRGKVMLRVSKNSLIERALEDGTKELKNYIEGEVGIIAANMNPFKLYKELEKMRMKAPAKGGEIAPEDIIIKKGDTPFKPGPIVGELQKVGIPAAIREGKVVIEKDVTLVKKGEKITPELAKVLNRLDIKPIEIGLKVHALFENGIIFTPDVLAVDEEKLMADLQEAARRAFTLAVETGYPTKETIEFILQKAYRNAYILATECNIYTKETIEEFIRKAYLHAKALEGKIGG